MFERLYSKGFEIITLHHAEAILVHDMKEAVDELEAVLLEISLPLRELVEGGGGEGKLTQRLRKQLAIDFGWRKHNFTVKKVIDGVETESTSHEIDHVKKYPGKGVIALEIEWNNKDPFFDRDLENFKRLHADGVISVGVIITRGTSLQDNLVKYIESFAEENNISTVDDLSIYYSPTTRQKESIKKKIKRGATFKEAWASTFVADKFGKATTHWQKLEDRVRRGVGNPCPLVLIGIPDSIIDLG